MVVNTWFEAAGALHERFKTAPGSSTDEAEALAEAGDATAAVRSTAAAYVLTTRRKRIPTACAPRMR
ncbi:hypothetical protein Prum_099550 [Phytohabitans rumicis]|uniref:Uncharacterized protein n=1 Tax=Phytohabitans rumicis TaxID=1076125 RepID=A0A6V8LGE7_9ACTN|nr:hypothetical protein Prum_099550 [Phytohabitans rumicis]